MKYALFKIPPAPFSRGSMNVSLYTAGAFGQDMAYKTTVLPLEKGAGGIFPNDPGIRHTQLNGGAAYQNFMLG